MTLTGKLNHSIVQHTSSKTPTFDQCSTAVDVSCVLHANCGADAHSYSIKRFRLAYNNSAYRSVRPYQFTHLVRTFDALIRNSAYASCNDAHLFYRFTSNVRCILQISIFLALCNAYV